MAREGLADRKSTMDAIGWGRVPANFLRHGIQHGQALRVIGHELAPEGERVRSRSMREFIHETLHVDGVLVDIDAAPEARRHRRVAHRMVHEQVRDAVADGVVAVGQQSLEDKHVGAILHPVRVDRGQDRLTGDAHAQRGQVAIRVEATGEPGFRDRMIVAMLHVLLARPQQLDRCAGHLLRDGNGLLDEVVKGPAPSEASAEMDLVDVALARRQSGGFGSSLQSRLAILCRAPDFTALGGPARGGIHRLHGGMVLVGIVVGGLDSCNGGSQRLAGITDLVTDEGLLCIESLVEHGIDGVAADLRILSAVPGDGQGIERCPGLPPGPGNNGDSILLDSHDLVNAGHPADCGCIETVELAAKCGALPDSRIEHAWQHQVRSEHLLAGELVDGVEALDGFADEFPLGRLLEFHFERRDQLCRSRGDLAVAGRSSGRLVGDDAVGCDALLHRHVPGFRSGLDEHLAGQGAALADIVMAAPDTLASARGKAAPGAVAREALARCRVLGRDFRPVTLELLGNELREPGQSALAHLGTGDPYDDGVVRLDDNPGIDLGGGGGVRTAGDGGFCDCHRQVHAERETGARGGHADQEFAARDLEALAFHFDLPRLPISTARWMPRRTRL